MPLGKKGTLLKKYISPEDQFLRKFDQKPEASSKSRRFEEQKYKELNKLRDGKNGNG